MLYSWFAATIAALKSAKLVFRLVLLGLFGTLIALSLTLSLTTSEGPDEVAHYFFIRYIAAHGGLPLDAAGRLEAGYKADLPPLFYLLVGLPGVWLNFDQPPYFKSNHTELRLNLVTGVKNITGWRMVRTEDPLRGEILLWYLGRWLTLLTGVAAVALILGLARAVAPSHPWLTLAAVALITFLPPFIYINSVTNYEPLTAALMAGYLWLLFSTLQTPRQLCRYFGLGLLVGLAAATRQTVWPVLLVVPLLLLWLVYNWHWDWLTWLRQMGLYVLGVLLTFGAWLLYLAIFFNRIAEEGWLMGLLSPIFVGDGSGHTSQQIASIISEGQIGITGPATQNDTLWQWGATFFAGVWGQNWQLWAALLLWGVVLLGLASVWRQQRLWLTLLGLNLGLLLLFPFLRFLFSGSASTAVARHFLFPAAPILVVLLVMGFVTWERWRLYPIGVMLVLTAVYLAQNFGQVAREISANAPYPIQTVSLTTPEPYLATFDNITLLRAEFDPGHQTLRLTLYWRADELSSQDYRLDISLLDTGGVGQARWLGQPLNGRYPTRAWLPGDRLRDEIDLPIAGLPAGNYYLRLQVLNDDGPISTGAGNMLALGSVALRPAPAMPTGQLLLISMPVDYTFWPPDNSSGGLPLFTENQSIVFTVAPQLFKAGLQLALVGPDGVAHTPTNQTGHTVIFTVAPHFASGDYRLRVEQGVAEQQTARAESAPLLSIETENRIFSLEEVVANPLEANFAGYVSLLGYNLPDNSVKAGSVLPVEFFWQAQQTIGADLIQFNHLIGPEGQQRAGRDRRAREVYSTLFWAPGEVVSDPYKLEIPADTPPGTYYLLAGWYLAVDESSVSLPLMQAGHMSDMTHVTIGPIEVMADHAN